MKVRRLADGGLFKQSFFLLERLKLCLEGKFPFYEYGSNWINDWSIRCLLTTKRWQQAQNIRHKADKLVVWALFLPLEWISREDSWTERWWMKFGFSWATLLKVIFLKTSPEDFKSQSGGPSQPGCFQQHPIRATLLLAPRYVKTFCYAICSESMLFVNKVWRRKNGCAVGPHERKIKSH